MNIRVVSTVNEAKTDDLLHKTVIVIDVLRATSVITTALGNGCRGVVPVETVFQAKERQGQGILLCGERFCKKIPGFDLGNSPNEYTPDVVEGKQVVMTTTNGTRAIQKALKADHVLAGSILNAARCAEAAVRMKRDIVMLCAGTQDEFSLEDGIGAGLLIERLSALSGGDKPALDDLGMAMQALYLQCRNRLEGALLDSANGKRLSRMGFREDVVYCATPDQIQVVPVLERDQMVPYKTTALSG